MKLIVGLGNPGKEYEKTRHNVGFKVLDLIANKINQNYKSDKFNGLFIKNEIDDEKVIFLKPQSYMNLSGEVVRKYFDFYKIDIDDIIIISDDLDMPVGKIRLRAKGSSGGHNGLKNIFTHLGTDKIKRIKIGVGNNKKCDTKDYVLGKFSSDETNLINAATLKVSEIVFESITADFNSLMSKYN